ncbi:MAG: peptide chain release factor 1 [Anaerolineae bacterium]|nr:MAG: peptide chain release factor 1 [Anaerolineae bacterium]MCL4877402.1 peptide chain release factor 1 [Anaerolineae bacterium]
MLEEKLVGIEARYNEIQELLHQPEVAANYEKVAELSREKSNLEEIVGVIRQYKLAQKELDDTYQLRDDPEMAEMAQDEIDRLETLIPELEQRIKIMLLPRDPRDDKDVIVEIRAGAGGDEAGLFAGDLFRMYTRYCENRRWKLEVVDTKETGVGGFKSITFEVHGKGAYSRLKYESGVHRVQRVPTTESQGRIHTSTATVAVLAEVDDIDFELDMNDVRRDVFRSSGAGGQHVNKTESAVRLTHLPTGIVVECQDQRSQHQNFDKAKQILRARLYEMELEKQMKEQDEMRRTQVGTGDRSEKIRTYNFKENRLTDHRINLTKYNLDRVLEGELDEFIDEITTYYEAQRLAALSASQAV